MSRQTAQNLKQRIVYLTVIRCATMILLLGSAMVINVNNVESLGHPTYLGLNILIASTFAFTLIVYLLLRSPSRLLLTTHLSLAYDAFNATGLVLLTGHLSSPFIFLFIIVSLFGGVVLGRIGGVSAASYCTLGLAVVLLFYQDVFNASFISDWKPDWDDSPFYRGITLTLAFYCSGLLSGLLSERLDRTESALASSERDRQALERFHQRVLECLGSGLITLDAEGIISFVNPAASTILGRPPEALLGKRVSDVGLPPPPSKTLEEEQRWESTYHPGEGEEARILGFTVSPFRDEETTLGRIVTFKDLTALRRIEERLQERERLASLGRFAASISHEIRNPLAAISGSIEMLSQAHPEDSEDAILMEITLREIDRLNGLVKSILEYARPKNFGRSAIDVVEQIRDSAQLFRNTEGVDGVAIAFDMPEHLHCVAARGVIQQSLWNLWKNAVEAMDSDGHLTTRLEVQGETLVIQVEDSGPGLPPEEREKVFEPFHTTKPTGTGLGLATVFQLVREQGGSIALLDTESGATFEIRLPFEPVRGEDVEGLDSHASGAVL